MQTTGVLRNDAALPLFALCGCRGGLRPPTELAKDADYFPTPAQCAHWAPSPHGEGFGSLHHHECVMPPYDVDYLFCFPFILPHYNCFAHSRVYFAGGYGIRPYRQLSQGLDGQVSQPRGANWFSGKGIRLNISQGSSPQPGASQHSLVGIL